MVAFVFMFAFRHVFGLMHNILVNSLDVVLLVFLACLVMAMA